MSQYFYVDKDNNQIDIQNGSQYMWIPVLYQELNGINPPTDDKYYDMLVAQGTILGSNYKRIHTFGSEKIIQNYYIQPIGITGLSVNQNNPRLWNYTNFLSLGTRVLIDQYDSTYGYIYPVTGDAGFNEQTITSNTAQGFMIYKLGNNYDELASNEKVDVVLSESRQFIPWEWQDLISNPETSYGKETYYVPKTMFSSTLYCPTATDLVWQSGAIEQGMAGFWKQNSTLLSINTKSRVVLNNQPEPYNDGGAYNYNSSTGEFIISVNGSPYNGIYTPGYSYSSGTYTYSGVEYIKVTVTWSRTSDANSIGALLNKVVSVNPQSNISSVKNPENGQFVPCANSNIQTNLYTISDPASIRLNQTAFYFITEQPIDLYAYTESELLEYNISNTMINKIGLILYNKPATSDEDGEILIRPSVGISEKMKFVTSNNQSCVIKKINTDIWKIYYARNSVIPTNSDLLYKTDETKFQVKTYFKIGDENPFYLYAEPNITMAFYPVGDSSPFSGDITQRAFTVKATYEQESYIQWKSFQYTLLDIDGNVLQQSPIIYDGEMEYSFYGLNPSTNDETANYKVKIVVETDTGYQKSTENQIIVYFSPVIPESSRMSVEFDCDDCTVKISNEKHKILNLSIYKREIWEGQTNSLYEPVVVLSDYFNIKTEGTIEKIISDYNLSNHTYYDYLLRYQIEGDDNTVYEEHFPIEINWLGWTLTELTKDYSEDNAYIVDATYVWKFKYNLDIGSQNHNIAKTSQDTLARFPKFSQGVKNYISGQTTCLLGRDVELYNSSNKYSKASYDNGTLTWGDVTGAYRNIGGYKEEMPDALRSRYNRGVDMMEAWKAFCYSGNPKLLKDNKGQTFIVQIHEDSYTIQENWDRRPTTISFSWTEIGDFKKYKISNPLK